ncbi:hypothetical protein pb186bvf_018780 [Paramecium bursaria]
MQQNQNEKSRQFYNRDLLNLPYFTIYEQLIHAIIVKAQQIPKYKSKFSTIFYNQNFIGMFINSLLYITLVKNPIWNDYIKSCQNKITHKEIVQLGQQYTLCQIAIRLEKKSKQRKQQPIFINDVSPTRSRISVKIRLPNMSVIVSPQKNTISVSQNEIPLKSEKFIIHSNTLFLQQIQSQKTSKQCAQKQIEQLIILKWKNKNVCQRYGHNYI